MEIEEQNDGTRLTLRVVCPGLRPEEVAIVVDGGRVRVRAEHAEESTVGGSRRRSSSVVAHAAAVPTGTAAGDVSAWLADGVLEVRLPGIPGPTGSIAVPVDSA